MSEELRSFQYEEEPYVEMASGNKIYLADLSTNQYNIRDIAHSLAQGCRFNGHSDIFYSVAQHSVYCSYMAPRELALEALMHDAAESITTDIPRPVKYFIKGAKEFDEHMTKDIFEKFNLKYPLDPIIHEVDNRMLATEARQIMPNSNIDTWGSVGTLTPYDIQIISWRPEHAEAMFLDRYSFLLNRRAMEIENTDNDDEYKVVTNQ